MGKGIGKEWQARMDGCLYAIKQIEDYNKDGKDGIAEFRQEMKRRGFVRLDISINEKEWNEYLDYMTKHLYTNMMVTMMYALNQSEGFGKQRLERVRENYNKAVKDAFDMNYMCEHYVTLTDYAVYMNEKYDLGLDADFVQANEDNFDESLDRYNSEEWMKGIINTLRLWGYDEPADRFQAKLAEKGIA